MIVRSVTHLAAEPLFLELNGLVQASLYLKVEGLNVAGSIKLKTAVQIVDDLEESGALRPGCTLIESSSGNLGLALAIICAAKRYRFICVGDPHMSPLTARLIRAYGAELIIVSEPDSNGGGYLHNRLRLIERMTREDPGLVWTNQYANPSNARAHYQTTGAEILGEFPQPDWVFIGAGTTGTVMGSARYLREHSARTHVVAVDSVGSVTFGGPPSKRYLPGIGTGRKPELADISMVDEVRMISERDAIDMCRTVLRTYGLLIGPSTGTVLAGVKGCADRIRPGAVVIAVSPDLGDRYADTAYDPDWVESRFPSEESRDSRVLNPMQLAENDLDG
jgi:N-(2-amino-2-carboxyethyl)-L-glutamate synthase